MDNAEKAQVLIDALDKQRSINTLVNQADVTFAGDHYRVIGIRVRQKDLDGLPHMFAPLDGLKEIIDFYRAHH